MEVPPSGILAYLGPCIGPAVYEVGADVYDAFTGSDPAASGAFSPLRPGKWLADLRALARRALLQTGVARCHGTASCTYANPQRFFSYRRDGPTGRMAALIWREPSRRREPPGDRV
jgi:copper oxidase (laccase) domain-containing protein